MVGASGQLSSLSQARTDPQLGHPRWFCPIHSANGNAFYAGYRDCVALMMFLGGKGVFLVYLCTIIALTISYAIGRNISPKICAKRLDWFSLQKARGLVLQIQPLGAEERLAMLNEKAPAKIAS
jgi:hypothetical protein